jgi:4-amino-4-deoxy-L-arabinose transferase-like glycosyltransferase
MSERRRVPWLWFILGGAFVIRLAAALFVQQWIDRTPGRLCLIEGDAEGYLQLGKKLARGEEYAIYDPPRYVERVPGFPLLLAVGIQLFGEKLLWIRILLAGVGAATCGLVYWLAEELFDRTTAIRAGLIAAIFPTFVVFSVLLLSETFFATMLLASLIALAKLVKAEPESTQSRALALAAGMLIGLATLVRPTWLLVGPGFVAIDLLASRDRRRATIHGMLLLAALGVTLLPWTIRNVRVTGHFVPTTLWVGPSLYDGLNEHATGASDMDFVDEDGFYRMMSEYDADHHYRDLAIDFAKAHPRRALELAAIKFWRFWNPFPNAAQFGHWTIAWGIALWAAPLLALAAYGGWLARRSLWCWLIPAAPVLYFSLVHSVFVGSIRYRLPAEYALVVLSAVGCGALVARWRPAAQT